MWARVVEIMLGCWLIASPFIFRHAADSTSLWVADWLAATAVITFGLLSFWRPLRRIHLLTVAVAVAMYAYGWMHDRPLPGGWQNQLTVALLLMMSAIVPNRASEPSSGWRDYYSEGGPGANRAEDAAV